MRKWLIRFFGLRGSWTWACKQMQQGFIVRPESANGSVKYKLDDEHQGRILWSFDRNPDDFKWDNAYIFLRNFNSTDWVIFDV